MCGFVGFLNTKNVLSENNTRNLLTNMGDAITHRGPDSGGYWIDTKNNVALAHRRLAIVDLSSNGHQPMESKSERYILIFNGEIYNHLDLRVELKNIGYSSLWQGYSDTETLLAGFDVWGIEETLKKTIGMFSFALWDRENKLLMLGRDRMGEKPLYYGWQGQLNNRVFLFGSDLLALRKHPSFEAEIDRNTLGLFMQNSCIGGRNSIYSNIYKLQPGNLLTISIENPKPKIQEWWSIEKVAALGAENPYSGSIHDAVETLDDLLQKSVRRQMVSDVPLGAFLSGGIDSSTIVALMQSNSNQAIKTFSIGFNEIGYNEAINAKAVAEKLGTDHTELYVDAQQALDVIPKLPSIYSEPFADSSQIPTFLVSELAKKNVTVSLSGDGGDELFCGYNRYRMTNKLWGTISKFPKNIRRIITNLINSVPPSAWDKIGYQLSIPQLGDKLHKGSLLLDKDNIFDLYNGLVSHWDSTSGIVLGVQKPINIFDSLVNSNNISGIEKMMLLDAQCYLPDDILTKVDRSAMSVSLETRIPFLDHQVVEFAWSLPINYKLVNGITKWPLKQVLNRYISPKLTERPKMGFGVPIDSWLRGPLRDWAEALLDESRIKQEGFFNPIPIRQKWAEHLSGNRNWQHQLWNVLMFQAWLEYNK